MRWAWPLAIALALVAIAPALPVHGRAPVGVVGREVVTSVERSRVIALPIAASHVAVHWRGEPDAVLRLEVSTDGLSFSRPEPVEHDDRGQSAASRGGAASGDRTDGDRTYGGVVWTTGARFVRVTSDRPIAQLSVVAINARSAERSISRANASVGSAAVEQPAVLTRAAWGANESFRFDSAGTELWPPEFYPLQKLTVHHTAGKNSDPDPAATVRAIYYYDAITKGWGDMGYNFLIDEAGRIYEGRYSRAYAADERPTGEDLAGNGVVGAHVGGYNAGTVGIALLGTLTSQDATPAARAALEQLLAWKAERHAIDPLATSLYTNPVSGAQKTTPNISGHRDWAATECPGGAFYSTFPSLRNAVSTRITGTPPAQTVPGAPGLTAASPTTGKGIKLSWTTPADGGSAITGYQVFRLNNGSLVRIASLGAATISYRDSSAKRGRTYTYAVRATNALGPGPYSNQASAVAR
jgi:hypothetical protein